MFFLQYSNQKNDSISSFDYKFSLLITVYQIFGPYLSLNFARLLLSITSAFCIGKWNCILTINDDKSFCQKVLTLSAFLFLVIEPFVTVYHRYAIFFRPISPSTEQTLIVVNRTVVGNV